MKKIKVVALAVVISIVFAADASAAPFIRSDAAEGVIGSQVTGAPATAGFPETIAARTDGAIEYDLANIPVGTYALKVSACNAWGCGETADLGFTKAVPAKPAGLRVSVK